MPMSEKAKEIVFLVGVYVAMLGGNDGEGDIRPHDVG